MIPNFHYIVTGMYDVYIEINISNIINNEIISSFF